MSTGDTSDFLSRLKALLPGGWFRDSTPLVDAVLTGISTGLSFVCSLTQYARLQTRIRTATDGFLDLISADFLGKRLPRRNAETDTAFRQRILAQLFLERGTRKGLIRALQILTGRTPVIFEPQRPADTGAYGVSTSGYGVAGGYGSLLLPHQCFVVAYRPVGQGIPNIAGYGISTGAYRTPSQNEYASLSQIIGAVTDSDIFATIDSVAPVGTILWTRISS